MRTDTMLFLHTHSTKGHQPEGDLQRRRGQRGIADQRGHGGRGTDPSTSPRADEPDGGGGKRQHCPELERPQRFESVTGYLILRRRPHEGEETLLVHVENTGSAATTYTDTNATSGVRYVYRVKAINAAGLSQWPNYARATP